MTIQEFFTVDTMDQIRHQAYVNCIAYFEDNFWQSYQQQHSLFKRYNKIDSEILETFKFIFEQGFKLGVHDGAAEAVLLAMKTLIDAQITPGLEGF